MSHWLTHQATQWWSHSSQGLSPPSSNADALLLLQPWGKGLRRVWGASVSSCERSSCLRTRSVRDKKEYMNAEPLEPIHPKELGSHQRIPVPATPRPHTAVCLPVWRNTFPPLDRQINIKNISCLIVTLTFLNLKSYYPLHDLT